MLLGAHTVCVLGIDTLGGEVVMEILFEGCGKLEILCLVIVGESGLLNSLLFNGGFVFQEFGEVR